MDKDRKYSDDELIRLLRQGTRAERDEVFELVYKYHKDYCLRFMKSKFGDCKEIKDIYQDAVIVFYENVNKPDWRLTCKIQTYLNSICFYQGLTRCGKSKTQLRSEDDAEDISDWFLPLEETVNEERMKKMMKILLDRTKTSELCYEILVRYWWMNQTMKEIAEAMGYKSAETAKNQKSRCQAALKNEM